MFGELFQFVGREFKRRPAHREHQRFSRFGPGPFLLGAGGEVYEGLCLGGGGGWRFSACFSSKIFLTPGRPQSILRAPNIGSCKKYVRTVCFGQHPRKVSARVVSGVL